MTPSGCGGGPGEDSTEETLSDGPVESEGVGRGPVTEVVYTRTDDLVGGGSGREGSVSRRTSVPESGRRVDSDRLPGGRLTARLPRGRHPLILPTDVKTGDQGMTPDRTLSFTSLERSFSENVLFCGRLGLVCF